MKQPAVPEPNRSELVGYLEEALAAEDMARIEDHLRTSAAWRAALAEIRDEVDTGDHSVATIWRRHRLTCPSREQLWAYSEGGLLPDQEDYIGFHLKIIKCRWCSANLADVRVTKALVPPEDQTRRRRFFQTSVGTLPTKKK